MGIIKNIDKQKGLKFDGVNDYVSIPNLGLQTNYTNTFSLSMIFSLQNLTGNKFLFITANQPSTTKGLYVYVNSSSLVIALFNTGETGITWQIPFTFNINITYNIVVSFSNGATNLYVDNILYANSVNGFTFGGYQTSNDTTSLTIYSVLARAIGLISYTNGKCYDLKIFNTALNQIDVTDLYNKSAIPFGCIADYRFDQKSGDILINYVGSNNGSLVNYAPSDYAIGSTNSWLYEDGTAYDQSKGKVLLLNNN
jgi:hypothetical protein